MQPRDTPGNANHAISVLVYWIYDSNYEKALFLTRESLDLIFFPSVGEEKVVKFEALFNDVRCMCSPGNPKMG